MDVGPAKDNYLMNQIFEVIQRNSSLGQNEPRQVLSLISMFLSAKIWVLLVQPNATAFTPKEHPMAVSNTQDSMFLARESLDGRLLELRRAASILTPPRGGWIKTVRSALGMTVSDLARRLNVGPSSALRIESNEIEGTLNLATLHKVANALDCEVVYALIPRQPTMLTAKTRAIKLARARLAITQQSMALEDQALDESVLEKLIERKASELVHSRGLWKDQLGVS